jgi:hypothetical protein
VACIPTGSIDSCHPDVVRLPTQPESFRDGLSGQNERSVKGAASNIKSTKNDHKSSQTRLDVYVAAKAIKSTKKWSKKAPKKLPKK